jgi:succinyl-diaminopimelate desuccinylase
MTPEAYLDQAADRIPELLSRLVSHRTVNPPGAGYDAMTELLRRELERVGMVAKRIAVDSSRAATPELVAEATANPRWNVLARRSGQDATRTLHFNAHYDVVPAAAAGWSHGSPFVATVHDGWIYGRGTADMKGSMVSLLLALEALEKTGHLPAWAVEVSFTADEETDSMLGSAWVVEHGGISPDRVVVMEGGEGNAVCCGHNGVVWLEVTVHGKAAHGSTPDKGINALHQMSQLVLALDDYKAEIAQRVFVTPGGVEMRPTLNVGGVFAVGEGAKINTVPAQARFSLDRRVLATENLAEVEAELRAFLTARASAIPDCRITVEKVTENASCFSPPDHAFFHRMAVHVADVRGEPSTYSVSTGFNDMHFFAHRFGVPTLGYGPGGDNCHGIDERASLEELLRCAKIYARLMLDAEI